MRITLDIGPLETSSNSNHKVRGVGRYIRLLSENLERYDKSNSYIMTSTPQKYKTDVIHYPYFDPFFITLPLIKKYKTVVTIHDVIPLIHKKQFPVGLGGMAKWEMNKILLKRVNAVITDSHASKEDIQKVTGIISDKIFPVYLSTDNKYQHSDNKDSKLDQIIEKYNIPKKFFLYVGDVTWNKNLPRIVAAIKKSNMPIVMVGKALVEDDFDFSNPWNKDRVKVLTEIKNNPLFHRVGFVSDEDLEVLYSNALALLMPSLDEGFGLPVLEAMEAGCPVITSKCGSLPEVGGDAAIYVEAESVSEITDAIMKVSNNLNLREELKKKGEAQAIRFSLKKMIENTIEVYSLVHNEKEN
ncbi:MAG: glycosyltransferase family 1 protein [Candidatus Levybacteria bacterium]|nr:glycosyltransferase family 1 protein [Candidatus Levybacteria bacterium]